MKWTKTHVFTLKEAPSDAEIPSHKLMVRGGFIKKLAPGLYTYGACSTASCLVLKSFYVATPFV